MTEVKRFGLKIYNCKTDKVPEGVAYVGRPSTFGNPWTFKGSGIDSIHVVKDRKTAIACFKKYVKTNLAIAQLAKRHLKGKDLSCWCSPESCHAEILMEVANT